MVTTFHPGVPALTPSTTPTLAMVLDPVHPHDGVIDWVVEHTRPGQCVVMLSARPVCRSNSSMALCAGAGDMSLSMWQANLDAWSEYNATIDRQIADARAQLQGHGIRCRLEMVSHRESVFDRHAQRQLARAIARSADQLGVGLLVVGGSDRHQRRLAELIMERTRCEVRTLEPRARPSAIVGPGAAPPPTPASFREFENLWLDLGGSD